MIECRRDQFRGRALGTASAIALIASVLTVSDAACAQTTGTANSGTETVVVTSTRVVRDGYEAPTPTTVVGEADIEAKAPSNLAEFVNELPSLAGSAAPDTAVASLGPGTTGINALNLRNLGPNRTLVLLDGQRVGSSTPTGWVDVNTFPQALVKRVDVVTGGASADWGSDAVAGVVNFILDKDFTGLKGTAQGGVTTYGDDSNYNLSLTAGTGFLNDRGHVLLSLEDAYDAGIRGVPRSWYNGAKIFFNPAYTATNGQPQLLAGANVGVSNATPGGLITSGPLQGTYFGPGGTPAQFNYGLISSNGFMQGGDWQISDFAKTGDLAPRLSRQNVFFRTSYDVTDNLQVFTQLSWGSAQSYVNFADQFQLGNLTIQPDNAFIPASIAAKVTGPFSLGTTNQDLGPIVATSNRTSWRAVLGASGKFNAFDSDWTWDVYGQKTINNIYTAVRSTITANYKAAIDSVRNANGVAVCRSTLTNPTNGCVPYDIFGTGVASQAAINYVRGTSWGRADLAEDVFAANLRGNPISDWAGPISVATGIEHRREGVGGTNDALSPSKAYFAGNYVANHGAYDVTEGYFETVVPLLKNSAVGESLDFNGAVRETGYSTSGVVTTWKLGLNYTPIDDITFRATQSHDIRAPNISELFTTAANSGAVVTDPFRGNSNTTIFQVTQGNLNLKPEEANSSGIGAVLRPRFLPGFTAAVDYYNINISGAISTVNAQTLINQCFAGNTALCSQITRDGTGAITQVQVLPINLAKQINRGLDFEASYHVNLDSVAPFLGGDLTLRGLATHYLKNYTNNGINAPTDTAGTNSQNGTTGGVAPSIPNWSYNATVGWAQGPLAMLLTVRGFSSGVLNTSYVQCTAGCPASTANNMTINNNYVPGAIYFDTNISYDINDQFQTFLSVDNIFDRDPVQVPYGPNLGGAPLSVNPALYDILGRTFRAGLRFKM